MAASRVGRGCRSIRDVCSRLAAILVAPLAALAFAAPASAVETGVVQTLGQTKPTAQTAKQLGAGWVRLWASWEQLEPPRNVWEQNMLRVTNSSVDSAKANGLKVVMVVQRSPAWASGGKGGIHPPSDPADLANAMRVLAAQVPGVDAWELWNEEDEGMFWAGGADPRRYAALVKAAYPAIKSVQPHDVVLTGPTTGNNYEFIEALYRHGIKGSFDAVAVHTDTGCLVNGPDVHYRDEQGRVGRFSFTGYREVHAVMARHGDGAKPIWMTELGWNTQSGKCPTAERPLGVSERQQAAFLTQAYRCLAADPFVQVAVWFGIQDIPGSRYAGGYGLFPANGSAKPSAAAFRGLSGGIAPMPCGGVVDTSGPSILIAKPTDGARFVDVLPIDAKAVDSSGGVGIRRIEIWADGRFSRSFGDGHALMRSFWPVSDWRFGRHTLTFKAEDMAHNKSERTITVTKLRPHRKAGTRSTVALELLDPLTVRVTGGVSTARARAASKPRGRAVLVFQRRSGDGLSWETTERIRVRAGRRFDVTRTLAPGSWRVFVRYPGHKRFR